MWSVVNLGLHAAMHQATSTIDKFHSLVHFLQCVCWCINHCVLQNLSEIDCGPPKVAAFLSPSVPFVSYLSSQSSVSSLALLTCRCYKFLLTGIVYFFTLTFHNYWLTWLSVLISLYPMQLMFFLGLPDYFRCQRTLKVPQLLCAVTLTYK